METNSDSITYTYIDDETHEFTSVTSNEFSLVTMHGPFWTEGGKEYRVKIYEDLSGNHSAVFEAIDKVIYTTRDVLDELDWG